MRSPRCTSLSSLLSTCSTMGIGGVASGTQLISGIAGVPPRLAAADGSQAGHTIWRPPWFIPAPRSGVRRLHSLPEQSSTATSSSSLERISERIADAVSRVGEGLQDFFSWTEFMIQLVVLKLWMSLGTGIFALFPNFKKVRYSGSELPPHSSP